MRIRSTLLGTGCLVLFAAAGYAATLSKADEQFLVMVAKIDMTEAHEGQMAENQAKRADVKDFAKTVVQDHTASWNQLSQLAAKKGVTLPTGIDTGKDRTVTQLVHLNGNRFDSQFAQDEIAAHRRAIAAFKREAASAQDPDVKAFANSEIPTLEKHLRLAEECAKQPKRTT